MTLLAGPSNGTAQNRPYRIAVYELADRDVDT
jgi:hypothetical protein